MSVLYIANTGAHSISEVLNARECDHPIAFYIPLSRLHATHELALLFLSPFMSRVNHSITKTKS